MITDQDLRELITLDYHGKDAKRRALARIVLESQYSRKREVSRMMYAVIVLLALLALFCVGWSVVAVLRAQDGRATALGIIAVACYALAQLLRSVDL